jgi:hypothetical protein
MRTVPVSHSANSFLLVLLDRLVAARAAPILVPDIGRELEEIAVQGEDVGVSDPEDLVEILAAVRALVANGLVVRSADGYSLTEAGQTRAASAEEEMDPELRQAIEHVAATVATRD